MLGWSKDELAARARMNVRTIIRFEAETADTLERTVRDIRAALEAGGVVFFEPCEGQHLGGCALRAEYVHTPSKSGGKGTVASDRDTSGGTASSAPTKESQSAPALDWDQEIKVAQLGHWRARPEQWAALAETSRQCLLRAMGVNQLWGE